MDSLPLSTDVRKRALDRRLADALRPLLDDPARRHAMGAAMKALARPGAAAAVIDWCEAQTR